jgi:GR25 family glycosyltransferase involved in LPS biosynthesis
MNLGYTIISVDDSRKLTKDEIRATVDLPEITDIDFVDGRDSVQFDRFLREYGTLIRGKNFFYGELGVWGSNLNAWKYLVESDLDALLVFEDDALPWVDFSKRFPEYIADLPRGFDFFSLHPPENQLADYYYQRSFNLDGGWNLTSPVHHKLNTSPHYTGSKYIASAYQGYGNVAMLYSKTGAQEILKLVERNGIYTPVDCFLYLEHHKGNLDGYTLMPNVLGLVDYDEPGSIARSTGMFN